MNARSGIPLVGTLLAFAACALELQPLRVVTPDTWMTLLLGRAISSDGLPTHNTLTLMGHDAPWVDQQWLAHLVWYWIYELSGFAGLASVRIALSIACLGMAAFSALRRGASAVAVSLVGLVALVLERPLANVRAQAFGELCFAVVLALLLGGGLGDGEPTRRVPRAPAFAAVPIVLALWANLHGTVFFGVLLVMMWLVGNAVDRRRRVDAQSGEIGDGSGARSPRASVWRFAFLLASAAAVLASPYGAALIPYYRSTLVSGTIRHFATEWQPPSTSNLEGVLFYVTAVALLALLVRERRRVSTFEGIALVALTGLGASSVRNVLFFGIAATFIGPRWIDSVLADRVRSWAAWRGFWATSWAGIAAACAFMSIIVKSIDP